MTTTGPKLHGTIEDAVVDMPLSNDDGRFLSAKTLVALGRARRETFPAGRPAALRATRPGLGYPTP